MGGAAAGLSCALPASAQMSGASSMRSLKILSAGSTLYGVKPVAEIFTRETGIPVKVATDHGHNIHKFALEGTTDADVVLVPADWSRELVAAGRTEKDALVDIGAVRIGACVREDAPKPDVSTMDAFKQALTAAQTVLLTNAPTGDHLLKVIERIGLADEVGRKLRRFDTATMLNKHLAANPEPGALGFGPTTEILNWRGKGVALAGTVPNEIQVVLAYQAAMLKRTGAGTECRKFLAFLATPAARKYFHDSGVE
ncbi:MAG TPA: substrate-binding domain-containing protein [Vicinamibacterales bacterium]|nr:substrate-binding domain-containing protein [Vicinamibacterales bacterium]